MLAMPAVKGAQVSDLVSFARLKNLPGPVWMLLFGNFFVRGSYYMVWPFIAVLLYRKFQLSAAEVGLWLTCAALLAVVSGFYAGYLSDKFGRKPLLLVAALVGVLAFSAFALAQSKIAVIGCIFLSTLPRALWDSPSKAWLGDLLPDSKDRELALQGLYFMVNAGAAIGPLFGIWAGVSGNQHAFFLTAFSYACLGSGILWLYRFTPQQQRPHHAKGLNLKLTLQILRLDQLFLLVIVANILINFIYAHADSSLIQYLTRANFPELVSLIAALGILNSLVIVTCQFPLLRLLSGWPVVKRIYLGIVLLALSQLWYALNPILWYWGWLGATLVLSLGEAILFANMNVHQDQLAPPALRGSYFGAASLYAVGFSLSPLIGGLVLDWLGGPALYFGSFLLCIGVVFCYRLSGRLRRPDFSQFLNQKPLDS